MCCLKLKASSCCFCRTQREDEVSLGVSGLLCDPALAVLLCVSHHTSVLQHIHGRQRRWSRAGAPFPGVFLYPRACSRYRHYRGSHSHQHHNHHHDPSEGLRPDPSSGLPAGEHAHHHRGDLSSHRHGLHHLLCLCNESQAQAGGI